MLRERNVFSFNNTLSISISAGILQLCTELKIILSPGERNKIGNVVIGIHDARKLNLFMKVKIARREKKYKRNKLNKFNQITNKTMKNKHF